MRPFVLGRNAPVLVRARRLTQILAGMVAFVGAVDAVGRLITQLGIGGPGPPEMLRMQPQAAIAFLAAGAALACIAGPIRWRRRLGLAVMAGIALLGTIALAVRLLQLDAGPAAAVVTVSPGVAIGFVLTAAAGTLSFPRARRATIAAQSIGIVLVLLSLNSLFGYAYRTEGLYRVFDDEPAIATTVAFGVLGVAYLYVDCRWGVGSVLVEPTSVGRLARQLVPTVLLAPLLLGSVAIEGVHQHWFGNGVAIALITTGSTVVVIAAISLSIRRLLASEVERAIAVEKLASSEALYRESFESAFIGIAHLDGRGRCLRANEQLARLLGRDQAELPGVTLDRLVHADDVGDVEARLRRLRLGETRAVEGQVRCLGRAGAVLTCETRTTAHHDAGGAFTHFTFVVLDVSAQHRLAVERERFLATALEERNRARAAANARDVLLGVVSHELRSPLNAIRLWLSLMQSDHDGGRDIEGRALLQVEHSVNTLTRLISDILDVSRIASGRLELERARFDLSALVARIVEQTQPAAAAKGVTLRAQFLVESRQIIVNGDELRLEQVVRNLLDNAIKFTPTRGCVTMSLCVRGDGTERAAEITVSDTGEGVPLEQLSHIFEQFRQVDDRTARRHGGLGLGLHIARHIIHRHGGTIRAHSDGIGQGASFCASLPLAGGPEEPDLQSEPEPGTRVRVDADAEGYVLVVDDEADTCDALAFALRLRGHEVRIATSTDQALAMIEERRPRVLVSDLMMPERSGYELIEEVRDAEQRLGLSRMRAIAISGAGGPDDRRLVRRSGFDGYLAKPIRVAELSDWIETATPPSRDARTILVVGPGDEVVRRLRAAGRSVSVAADRIEAVRLANRLRPALAIIDLDDERLGVPVARKLRAELLSLLIIGLTSRPTLQPDSSFDFVFDRPQALSAIQKVLRATAVG